MFEKLDFDAFDICFFLGVPLFFAGLSYFGLKSVSVSVAVFFLGLLGMASFYGHESPAFRLFGVFTGVVLGVVLMSMQSFEPLQFLGAAFVGGIIGYVLARWGYWIIELISHAN